MPLTLPYLLIELQINSEIGVLLAYSQQLRKQGCIKNASSEFLFRYPYNRLFYCLQQLSFSSSIPY